MWCNLEQKTLPPKCMVGQNVNTLKRQLYDKTHYAETFLDLQVEKTVWLKKIHRSQRYDVYITSLMVLQCLHAVWNDTHILVALWRCCLVQC